MKSGKSVEEKITDVVVRYFAKSNPSKQFFFNQKDLDTLPLLNSDRRGSFE